MSENKSGGWNRPAANQPTAKRNAKAPSKVKGVVAGLVTVCALGGLCLWMFSGKDAAPKANAAKERGRIKEVTPAAVPTNKVTETKKPVDPREDYDHTTMYRDEDGILRYNTGQRAYDPTRKFIAVDAGAGEIKHFKHSSERYIADLLDTVPGEKRFFTPDYYSQSFYRDFMKSLNDPIEILDEDSEDTKELKAAVAETKKEIKQRLDKGETLGDILTSASRELERLGEYKEQWQNEVGRVVKEGNGKFSDDEIRKLVEAANKSLEERGCSPVSADRFILSNIRIHAKNLGLSADETRELVTKKRQDLSEALKNEEH